MAENQTMSSWDRIRQGVADVENLMDQKQYNLSMVRGRQTLEYMINYLAQSVRLQAPDMSTAIDELYNLKVISAQSRENYHDIRSLGNRAAHEGNNSSADAASSYQMLSREVYAFADSYAKTARQIGQMIRNGQEVPTRGTTTTRGASARNGYTLDTQPEIGLTNTGRTTAAAASGGYSSARSTAAAGTARSASQRSSYTERRQGSRREAGSQSTGYQESARQGSGYQGARTSSQVSGARNYGASGAGNYGASGARGYGSSGARNYESSDARSQSGRASALAGARRNNRSSATIAGVSPEIILKIMIPIILVILLVAVIKFVTNKSSSSSETQTSAVVETESVAETMQVVTAAPIPVQTTEAQTEPETTQAPVYKYTTIDSLKVRTAPGTDAGVIDVLPAGTEVVYIEQTDDKWSKISYNGTEAYVATEYLKKEQVQ